MKKKEMIYLLCLLQFIAGTEALKCYWCSGVGEDRDCEGRPQSPRTPPTIIDCKDEFCVTAKVIVARTGEVKSFARLCDTLPRGNQCVQDDKLITCFETCRQDLCNSGNPGPQYLRTVHLAIGDHDGDDTTRATVDSYNASGSAGGLTLGSVKNGREANLLPVGEIERPDKRRESDLFYVTDDDNRHEALYNDLEAALGFQEAKTWPHLPKTLIETRDGISFHSKEPLGMEDPLARKANYLSKTKSPQYDDEVSLQYESFPEYDQTSKETPWKDAANSSDIIDDVWVADIKRKLGDRKDGAGVYESLKSELFKDENHIGTGMFEDENHIGNGMFEDENPIGNGMVMNRHPSYYISAYKKNATKHYRYAEEKKVPRINHKDNTAAKHGMIGDDAIVVKEERLVKNTEEIVEDETKGNQDNNRLYPLHSSSFLIFPSIIESSALPQSRPQQILISKPFFPSLSQPTPFSALQTYLHISNNKADTRRANSTVSDTNPSNETDSKNLTITRTDPRPKISTFMAAGIDSFANAVFGFAPAQLRQIQETLTLQPQTHDKTLQRKDQQSRYASEFRQNPKSVQGIQSSQTGGRGVDAKVGNVERILAPTEQQMNRAKTLLPLGRDRDSANTGQIISAPPTKTRLEEEPAERLSSENSSEILPSMSSATDPFTHYILLQGGSDIVSQSSPNAYHNLQANQKSTTATLLDNLTLSSAQHRKEESERPDRLMPAERPALKDGVFWLQEFELSEAGVETRVQKASVQTEKGISRKGDLQDLLDHDLSPLSHDPSLLNQNPSLVNPSGESKTHFESHVRDVGVGDENGVGHVAPRYKKGGLDSMISAFRQHPENRYLINDETTHGRFVPFKKREDTSSDTVVEQTDSEDILSTQIISGAVIETVNRSKSTTDKKPVFTENFSFTGIDKRMPNSLIEDSLLATTERLPVDNMDEEQELAPIRMWSSQDKYTSDLLEMDDYETYSLSSTPQSHISPVLYNSIIITDSPLTKPSSSDQKLAGKTNESIRPMEGISAAAAADDKKRKAARNTFKDNLDASLHTNNSKSGSRPQAEPINQSPRISSTVTMMSTLTAPTRTKVVSLKATATGSGKQGLVNTVRTSKETPTVKTVQPSTKVQTAATNDKPGNKMSKTEQLRASYKSTTPVQSLNYKYMTTKTATATPISEGKDEGYGLSSHLFESTNIAVASTVSTNTHKGLHNSGSTQANRSEDFFTKKLEQAKGRKVNQTVGSFHQSAGFGTLPNTTTHSDKAESRASTITVVKEADHMATASHTEEVLLYNVTVVVVTPPSDQLSSGTSENNGVEFSPAASDASSSTPSPQLLSSSLQDPAMSPDPTNPSTKQFLRTITQQRLSHSPHVHSVAGLTGTQLPRVRAAQALPARTLHPPALNYEISQRMDLFGHVHKELTDGRNTASQFRTSSCRLVFVSVVSWTVWLIVGHR